MAPLTRQIASLVRTALYDATEDLPDHQGSALVEEFYAARNFQPAWLSQEGREAASVLVDRMSTAARDGLPMIYEADAWAARLARPRDDLLEAIRFDVRLSSALLRFATHLSRGIGDPDLSQRSIEPARILAAVSDPMSAMAALLQLEPVHQEYRALRSALMHYRNIEARGGWPRVPEDVILRRVEADPLQGNNGGSADPADKDAVVATCDRLRITGDLRGMEADGCAQRGVDGTYDALLEDAVRAFQARHGLLVDGIVGPNTASAMNVPVSGRVNQIQVNMNRWRRLPDDLGSPHVMVNIPAFRLHVHDGTSEVMAMRVVAGEPETPTPVMSDRIRYLVFRPYWNIPASITRTELLPKIRKDPSYLRTQQLEVVDGWSEPAVLVDPSAVDWHAAPESFPYRLRQRPGPHNSLGLLKFMFPNAHSVYLHDTPSTHRFEERRRAFSHGCVRVEDPAGLAEFLLHDDHGWTRADIETRMHTGDRQVVPLSTPVPVHLTYFTAWTAGDRVHFQADLYGRDTSDSFSGHLPQATESQSSIDGISPL